MKRFFAALLMMAMMISPAAGLSDSEYLRMRKSNADFRAADKRLNQVWASLKKSLPARIFSQLDKLQREWVISGRDEEAESLMSDGYSRMEAYTIATNDRADSLPGIAKEIRESSGKNSHAAKPASVPKPRKAPEPEPEPEQEEPVSLRLSDVEGEYQNDGGFLSVKIIDRNADELEVTFSRFKDGTHWTARGWLEGNILELYDSNYSSCQATLTFSRRSVKADVSDTDDWNEAISPDFVLKGTYRKLAN